MLSVLQSKSAPSGKHRNYGKETPRMCKPTLSGLSGIH
ncbi:hypothetical protein NECAME_07181 [Necator americanus]|uniref:Uncharacterized protein n=1 Tax=Necator americanus TaxID=51031 RepID=W2TPX6_NECAM|nr:hypothetical protein NECAME_07181 [Necator americanus]ETN83818.1 hypothetical protein NECAME_07181 [Necator americanus]